MLSGHLEGEPGEEGARKLRVLIEISKNPLNSYMLVFLALSSALLRSMLFKGY
jgi:hypothetical protein